MTQTLLVTGGAGFIGSHTLLQLLAQGYRPVVLDDFSNSSMESIRRVEQLSGRSIRVLRGNVCVREDLERALCLARDDGAPVSGVIHFAGLKAVGESVAQPLRYYAGNVGGMVTLLGAMDDWGIRHIIFSSSATVYGVPSYLPYDESHGLAPTNPYGWTKAMCEQILADWSAVADAERSAICLRYFNPIGAHESGMIGEDPRDIPNNLFPFITQVAIGKRPALVVYGNDYDTVDGTGVRDYVHVEDLAAGHVKAVQYADSHPGFHAFNLGTGHGTSVLQMIAAFEQATGMTIPYRIEARRPGDIGAAYADPTRAATSLGWQARRDVAAMCADGWRWQRANPDGYAVD